MATLTMVKEYGTLFMWLLLIARGYSLTTSGCGSTLTCIKSSSSCNSHVTCEYIIMYKANLKDETVEFTVSAKLSGIKWLALGFNTNGNMDGGKGEVCLLPGSGMKSFINNGYTPSFGATTAVLLSSNVQDGALICKFRRNIKQNGHQVNLFNSWNILLAYGNKVSNGNPSYHQRRLAVGRRAIAVRPSPTSVQMSSSSQITSLMNTPKLSMSPMATSSSMSSSSVMIKATTVVHASVTVRSTATIRPSGSPGAGNKKKGDGNNGHQLKGSCMLAMLLTLLTLLLH